MTAPRAPSALDSAVADLSTAPEDENAARRLHARLAESELFLLLAEEADEGSMTPALFDTSDGRLALVFDSAERLAAFSEGPAAHAVLGGRQLAALLAGRAIGIGLNLGSDYPWLLPAEAIDWLAQMLAAPRRQDAPRPEAIRAPGALDPALLAELDAKFALMAGMAGRACLAAFDAGEEAGLVLVFLDPAAGAEEALLAAVGEALAFSGQDSAYLDVAFAPSDGELAARLLRVGVVIDLPERHRPGAPGGDPQRPPRLR